jgi:hypothetical protein
MESGLIEFAGESWGIPEEEPMPSDTRLPAILPQRGSIDRSVANADKEYGIILHGGREALFSMHLAWNYGFSEGNVNKECHIDGIVTDVPIIRRTAIWMALKMDRRTEH